MKFLSLNISIFLLFLEPGNIFINRAHVCSDTQIGKLCSTIKPVNNTSAFVILISGFSVTKNLKREEVAVLFKADLAAICLELQYVLSHHKDSDGHTINQFWITHKRNSCCPVLALIQGYWLVHAAPSLIQGYWLVQNCLYFERNLCFFLGLSCVRMLLISSDESSSSVSYMLVNHKINLV